MMEQDNQKDGAVAQSTETAEQSMALAEITKDLLDATKQHLNKVYIILAISIVVNIVIVGAFLWYESHMELTTTETITQTVDGENSKISNYNDKSVHNENLNKDNENETE